MSINLQRLLDEHALDGGDVPGLLADLSISELTELERSAVESFEALRGENISAADLAALEQLADVAVKVREVRSGLEAAAADRSAAADALASRLIPPVDAPDPVGDPPDTDAAVNIGPGADAGADAGTTGLETEPAGDVDAGQPALVAGTRPRQRVDLSRLRVARPAPVEPPGGGLDFADVVVAAADVPGVATGVGYTSWANVAASAMRRAQTWPSAPPQGGRPLRMQNGLAVIRKPATPELTIGNGNDDEVLAYAASESRLPGGSLVAAGGWCAPSETWYDVCNIAVADNLYELPEVQAPRGGVRWTKGVDFCDVAAGTGFFTFTETQLEATPPPTKPCMTIPCPEFDECRLDVDGLCITTDILQQRGYPEIVADFLAKAMVAHRKRMAARRLQEVIAGSDAKTIPAATPEPGATASILDVLELQAMVYRDLHSMAWDSSLELVLPMWVRGLIRSDLAKRNGYANPFGVTDEMINDWFSLRGLAPQWVRGFDELGACPPGGTPPPLVTSYPATVRVVMYAAGSWVAAVQDVITLDTVYDSAGLSRNQYTGLFTEEAVCVINKCNQSWAIQIPVCPSGNTGAQVAITCPTTA